MTTAHGAAEEHVTPPSADDYCERCRKPLVDGLTGVLDRHEWDRRAAEAAAEARERGLPVALILADLDSFKSVNDTYGHLAGDAVLRAVADVLADIEGGITGRYGGHAGDEFLVLLPGATAAEAAATARRMQAAVRGLVIPARASRSASVTIDGQTVSMGVAAEQSAAAGRGCDDVLSDLLLDADVGLRAAKRAGGDLVCGADGSPGEGTRVAVPRPRRPRVRGRTRARAMRGVGGPGVGVGGAGGGGAGVDGVGVEGEVRIPLASFGQDARGGPDELVLSSAAAEHLHQVLTEALGRPPSPRVGLP